MEKVQQDWNKIYSNAEERWRFRTIWSMLISILTPNCRILEAGCGSGGVCSRLERHGTTIGLDFSRAAIIQARKYCRSSQFIVADVTHLPFKKDVFNIVISLGVVEHFRHTSEMVKTFTETRYVLLENGFFFCTVPNILVPTRNMLTALLTHNRLGLYHKLYTARYLQNTLNKVGFKTQVRVVDVWIPVFFLIDGFIRKVHAPTAWRRLTHKIILRLPELRLLKPLSGHITLIATPFFGVEK